MIKKIIVAYNENRIIGDGNKIPWNIKGDLNFFYQTTKNHAILMGRKTWDSLPKKPLKERFNIVMTSDPAVYSSRKEGADLYINNKSEVPDLDTLFIIGGSQIYNLFIEECDVIIASEVKWTGEVKNPVYFPEIPWDYEKETIKKEPEYDVIIYKRL